MFKSDWIRDMGEFYGINLFLAESSATTGGLDSLLEPTGNIKKAQEMAARAFGADHVFFVTNGTSTSNKMVVQALVQPGDIVIVDRNCHKSHHYGMVLGGGQPLYVEAFPLTQYSMYGAVPLQAIKKALLDLQRRRPARPRADARPDQLHLRRPHVQHAPGDGGMPRHQAGPDLPVGRGVVRLCALVALPAPAHGDGRGGATSRSWLRDPASVDAYEKQQAELGDKPIARDAAEDAADSRSAQGAGCASTRPTRPTSRCRRSARARWCWCKDVDFRKVESQFHEAVFTHASTSPNQQLIASLDVARRQMELEGYGLVMNAISIALKIRTAVNNHPLISKYFRVLGADEMIPEEYRQSGFKDFLAPGTNWGDVVKAMREDEFYLDPTRMTLVCGTAGFDGTQFKGLLANRFNIQVNKTSRNSVLLQSNINNTRSDVAHLHPRAGRDLRRDRGQACASGGEGAKQGLRGARQEPDGRRAGPAELQPLPRRVPRGCRQDDATKATCAPPSSAPMTRRTANTCR